MQVQKSDEFVDITKAGAFPQGFCNGSRFPLILFRFVVSCGCSGTGREMLKVRLSPRVVAVSGTTAVRSGAIR